MDELSYSASWGSSPSDIAPQLAAVPLCYYVANKQITRDDKSCWLQFLSQRVFNSEILVTQFRHLLCKPETLLGEGNNNLLSLKERVRVRETA